MCLILLKVWAFLGMDNIGVALKSHMIDYADGEG